MSKSKSLAVIPSVDPTMAAKFHRATVDAAAIGAGCAVLCGLELRAIQKSLKSASTCTFDQWLEANEEALGFKRRTAFNYLAAADQTKAKLLKSRDKSVLTLLESSPGSMSQANRAKLLEAVKKCTGGRNLMEIYIEFGILRDDPKSPRRLHNGDSDSSNEPPPVTPDEEANEQLELFSKWTSELDRTTEVDGAKVLVITLWPKSKLDAAIEMAKRNLTLLVKVRGGRK